MVKGSDGVCVCVCVGGGGLMAGGDIGVGCGKGGSKQN